MGEKGKYMGKNILVAYSSKTGNTKKLAEGILDGIKKMEGGVVDTADIVDIKDIKDISEIDKYDTVIAGYWVDKGGANEEAAVFLKKITGKKVGIFATLAYWPDSEHGYNCVTAGENLVKENNHVIGKFVCQGKLDEKIEETHIGQHLRRKRDTKYQGTILQRQTLLRQRKCFAKG